MAHQFNPERHHRRSIRLKGYDYAQTGAYFITICSHQKKHWFGEIQNELMVPNAFGRIAAREWELLSDRFPEVTVMEYVIMPNHMHGLLLVGAPLAGAQSGYNDDVPSKFDGTSNFDSDLNFDPPPKYNDAFPPNGNGPLPYGLISDDPRNGHPQGVPLRGTEHLGEIVGAYKSLVACQCLELFIKHRPGEMMGKLWQRNYWEHIIRTETAYHQISNYIRNNPKNWHADRFSKK